MSRATKMSVRRRPDHRRRALTLLAAVAATQIIWVVSARLLDIDLAVRLGSLSNTVGAAAVAAVTLAAGLVGYGLLVVLESLPEWGRAVWRVIAVLGLLLSLAGPLAGACNTSATVSLVCMHLAAALILVPGLSGWATRR